MEQVPTHLQTVSLPPAGSLSHGLRRARSLPEGAIGADLQIVRRLPPGIVVLRKASEKYLPPGGRWLGAQPQDGGSHRAHRRFASRGWYLPRTVQSHKPFFRKIVLGYRQYGASTNPSANRQLTARRLPQSRLTPCQLPPGGSYKCRPSDCASIIVYCSLTDFLVDSLADGLKAAVNILVGETEYFQAIFLKTSTSLFVILHFLGHIMLRAIQFHYQLCMMTVKIYNIAFDGLLTLKPGGIFT